jgi:hypothetical protein
MKNYYRIVKCSCHTFNYEVQKKRWWFPFWLEVKTNTFRDIEDAKSWIKDGCPNVHDWWLDQSKLDMPKKNVVYYEKCED